MNWAVYIAGDPKLLNEMSQTVKAIKGYEIHKDNNGVYLNSDKFEELDDPDKIRKTVEELIFVINGCLKLISEIRNPLSVAGIDKIKPDGSREIFMYIQEGIGLSAGATASIIQPDGTVIGDNISTFDHGVLQRAIEIAQADSAVVEVLKHLNQPSLEWSVLYNVYEIIKNDVGEPLSSKGWASNTEIKNFTHTSQSPGAIGPQARHGIDKNQPPTNPMSYGEAKHLIGSIFKVWINSKYSG